MPTENNRIWTPGEIITANKLNYIENFLTNISTNFVSTQGSTISGNIVYKLTNVDLAQTNNGVDAKLYPAIAIFQDNNEKSFARVEGAVWSDNEEEDFKGSTWVTIWARNYKTSDGTEATNALRLGVNKNGKLLVKFTDEEKEAWRDALGIISDDYMTIDNAILHETGSTQAQSILTPLTTTHYFGGTSGGGQWWQGKNNALFRNEAVSSSDTYYPTISMKSPNGSWTIGTYQDNSLRFVYTLSSATSNTDTYNYSINANGVFSGTASKITSRTLTIGNTGKTFNGTANVSWSLNEIGAAAASHSHSNITARWGSSKGTKPSSDSWLLGSFSHESGTGTSVSNRLAGFENQIDTSGTSWFWIRAYQNTSGSSAQNYLAIGKKQDGTSMVSVSDAAAWRSALGLDFTWDINTLNTKDTWVPVMDSGTVQHRVLPTWLNSLSTVPIEHGGTGATTKTAALTALGAAATNHASTTSTYGLGNATNYGHVKVSDNYTSSAGAASAGVAASSKAVYDVYQAALAGGDHFYYCGNWSSTGTQSQNSFTLPKTGTWIIFTGHNSTPTFNGAWFVRAPSDFSASPLVINIFGGTGISSRKYQTGQAPLGTIGIDALSSTTGSSRWGIYAWPWASGSASINAYAIYLG